MNSEDYKAIREDARLRKSITLKTNREKVDEMIAQYDLEVYVLDEHHLRIELRAKKLDYFPQSGKATWLGSGKFFRIADIIEFIKKALNKR